ncbi:hypothetical protein JCM3775_007148 [Rhodotorula graminis]
MPRSGRGKGLSTTQDPLLTATRWQPHARPHPPPPPPPPTSSAPANPRPPKHQRCKGHAQHHSPTSWQPVHLHHFSPTAAEWLPLHLDLADYTSTAATSLDPKLDSSAKVVVLTYNTWSSSPLHTSAQSRAILDLVRTSRSDLVVLQEVTSTFFRLLSHEPWLREWFVSTPDDFWRVAGTGAKKRGKEGDDEACVVLVRRALVGRGTEVKMARLDRARDEGGRAAIAVKLCSRGVEQIRLVTSHFSPLPDNASLRLRQYKACLSFLSSAPASSTSSSSSSRPPRPPIRLLVGDFNTSSAAELAPFSSPPHSLTDACPSAPPPRAPASAHDASFASPPTFGHLYPLVTVHSRKARKARRIDRVYFSGGPGAGGGGAAGSGSRSAAAASSGGGARVRVVRYEHLGGERAVEGRDRTGRDGKVWASDHEAVRVELEWGG